jgi:hypothetical protein
MSNDKPSEGLSRPREQIQIARDPVAFAKGIDNGTIKRKFTDEQIIAELRGSGRASGHDGFWGRAIHWPVMRNIAHCGKCGGVRAAFADRVPYFYLLKSCDCA